MEKVKERPILFSGEMVRAILEGRKTQTRRVIVSRYDWYMGELDNGKPWPFYQDYVHGELEAIPVKCKYGQAGDQLWLRETFGLVWPGEFEPETDRECDVQYRADLPSGCTDYPGRWPADEARGNPEAPKWKPSIYMPRWASRINLRITDIRVERVQDISEEDCEAEGIDPNPESKLGKKLEFRELWNSINKKRGFGWDENPSVWVVEFERVRP